MPRVLRFFQRGLREKPRVAFAVGLAVFAATALYTFTRPKIYEATAIFVTKPESVIRLADNSTSQGVGIVCGPGVNTDLQVIESGLLTKRVANQLSASEKTELLSASQTPSAIANEDRLISAIKHSRRIRLSQSGTQIEITVHTASPASAELIATLYAAEMSAWKYELEVAENQRALDQLLNRMVQERDELSREAEALVEYRSRKDIFSLENDPAETRKKDALKARQDEFNQLLQRYRDLSMARPGTNNHRAVIPATRPAPNAYVSPNRPLHLGAGLLAALAFGPLAAALAARRSVPRDPTSET